MKAIKYGFVLLVFWLAACSPGGDGVENIVIKGSDTEVNLALTLAENYMEKDPNISIAVSGGGSGAGIAALINGKTEIANSSRSMKEEEIQLARQRGIAPLPIIFAVDALAIAVNGDLQLEELTIDQIGAIFSGDITNWKEVGGPDRSISLYGRQSNSGTFIYFREEIVKADYAQSLKQMNGTAQIVEALKSDQAGIGYVGVGYVVNKTGKVIDGVKVLKVKQSTGMQAYSPAVAENIISGNYPIVRPLYQYTDGVPGEKLRDFMLYILSDEGQQLVQNDGFYPVSKQYWAQNEKVLNFTYASKAIN